jgi:hypothetical protein
VRELTVRSGLPGKPVADRVRADSAGPGPTRRRIVILIHGYQNSEDKAGRSFRRFISGIGASLGFRDPGRVGEIWGFHWPGDHRRSLVSVLTYSSRVGDAERSGERLADYICEMRPDQQVVLVAHSLGCRVALEAVRQVRLAMERDVGHYRGARLSSVFLFAAAVPVALCETDEAYLHKIPGCREFVFYSSKDRALGMAFWVGEGTYSASATAVGRSGGPDRQRWTYREHTGLGHGDYWRSDKLARKVIALLGFGAAVTPEERVTFNWPEDRSVRALPERHLSERSVGSRRMG